MPRLVERIQAAAAATTTTAPATAINGTSSAGSTNSTITTNSTHQHHDHNLDVHTGQIALPTDYGVAQTTPSCTPENSSNAASSESYGADQISRVSELTEHYVNIPVNNNPSQDYFPIAGFQAGQSLTSPAGNYFSTGLDHLQAMEQNHQWLEGGDTSDNLWNVEDMWFFQQQLPPNTGIWNVKKGEQGRTVVSFKPVRLLLQLTEKRNNFDDFNVGYI